jgi:hypothetical protein
MIFFVKNQVISKMFAWFMDDASRYIEMQRNYVGEKEEDEKQQQKEEEGKYV